MNPKIDERIKEEYEAKIKGEFKIYLGNKLYAKGKNKWTRYFASSIVEFVILDVSPPYCSDQGWYTDWAMRYASGLSRTYTARAGTDTVTPTTPNMSDLVNKIDIEPDTKSRAILRDSDYSKYVSRFIFNWNPTTIPPQTIGELGVYLTLTDDSWESPYENPSFGHLYLGVEVAPIINPALRLGARISSADGDFNPINYTSEDALILEWFVTIKF